MKTASDSFFPASKGVVWQVGALCLAVADALNQRFNPVTVQGEISGFSRAGSGHCYFSLKDTQGQIRCALFRKSALALDFEPRDGDLVEVNGRLDVYAPRGDLQLIVESMQRAGQGALFEQFLRLKERLRVQGWFDPERKRALPAHPRGIGVITSPGAAALHDVLSALARRVPHVPVVISPASVQGQHAVPELIQALQRLQNHIHHASTPPVDVILIVRGGGSLEDLWSFNDETLAHALMQSPVPVISGVGHETDFTIADFVADVRAPTPTAAAELCATPRQTCLQHVDALTQQLSRAIHDQLHTHAQRLDWITQHLGRPSMHTAQAHAQLDALTHRMKRSVPLELQSQRSHVAKLHERLQLSVRHQLQREATRVEHTHVLLQTFDPHRVLQRGYAWLRDDAGRTVTQAAKLKTGQVLQATLAQGQAELIVSPPKLI